MKNPPIPPVGGHKAARPRDMFTVPPPLPHPPCNHLGRLGRLGAELQIYGKS